mmetsp:Transcript_66734/g.188573  ORF Transcript_66734/g.188573 Transcript_66734/m.188573 type:complete len:85 (-) Transcript_66734:22-276(-)
MFFGCCCTEQGGEIVAESAAGTASPPAVPATESVWKANDKQEEPAKLKSIDEAAPVECQVWSLAHVLCHGLGRKANAEAKARTV